VDSDVSDPRSAFVSADSDEALNPPNVSYTQPLVVMLKDDSANLRLLSNNLKYGITNIYNTWQYNLKAQLL
jgi:hypothetical protein